MKVKVRTIVGIRNGVYSSLIIVHPLLLEIKSLAKAEWAAWNFLDRSICMEYTGNRPSYFMSSLITCVTIIARCRASTILSPLI